MKLTLNFKGQKCTSRLLFFRCKIVYDVKYVQLKMFNFLVFDCIFANALKTFCYLTIRPTTMHNSTNWCKFD